ncbi:hypothetical protein BJ170DRAFT_36889 [Xylariales sp. AK1849]|nr:hypothetical protein BJ170DRAFT_36889 [Xylariales sp. AK1849]
MSNLPCYIATLAPEFDATQDNVIGAILVTVRLTDVKSKSGSPLLKLPLNQGPTPTLRYDGDALTASDDSGLLPLLNEDSDEKNVIRTWSATRDPVGQIQFRFTAVPRQTSDETETGPRIDLRADQGGAIGKGYGFLPYPPADEDWDVEINWKLPDSAPHNLHVACSHGDGLTHNVMGRPQELVAEALFAVGALNRFPSWESGNLKGDSQEFAMYWIGDLPYDIERVGPLTESLFRSIAGFFGDSTNDFRVFIRRVWSSHGGTGAYRSFLLEYSPGTEQEQSENGLIDLLAHETVHEYPLMQPMDMNDAWYSEGVANYYATIAAFEGGAVDRQNLIRLLNDNAQAYYTAVVINLPWKYIVEHYWDNYAMTKAGYSRGFIYLTQVQGLIQRATGGKKGVDDIVMALYEKQLKHEDNHSDDFHNFLSEYIGKEETEKVCTAMEGGEVIVPPADCFVKYGLKMVRRDVEKFEAGFDPNSLRVNKIMGLIDGSRAKQAGLREGDKVARAWMLWSAGDSLENMMQVVVNRDGQEVPIKYWPRSHEMVENWIWVEDNTDASTTA